MEQRSGFQTALHFALGLVCVLLLVVPIARASPATYYDCGLFQNCSGRGACVVNEAISNETDIFYQCNCTGLFPWTEGNYCDLPSQCEFGMTVGSSYFSENACFFGVCTYGSNCSCSSGWDGPFCNFPLSFDFGNETADPCDTLAYLCENGATCQGISGYQYTCNCPPGYYGDLCEWYTCDTNPCLNGATCTANPGNSTNITCLCPPEQYGRGYEGDHCQDHYASCGPTGMCHNGGSCWGVDYTTDAITCLCFGPWTGNDCSTYFDICTTDGNPCGPGNCTASTGYAPQHYTCTCPTWYYGPNCEKYDYCGAESQDPQQCLNGLTQSWNATFFSSPSFNGSGIPEVFAHPEVFVQDFLLPTLNLTSQCIVSGNCNQYGYSIAGTTPQVRYPPDVTRMAGAFIAAGLGSALGISTTTSYDGSIYVSMYSSVTAQFLCPYLKSFYRSNGCCGANRLNTTYLPFVLGTQFSCPGLLQDLAPECRYEWINHLEPVTSVEITQASDPSCYLGLINYVTLFANANLSSSNIRYYLSGVWGLVAAFPCLGNIIPISIWGS